MSKSTKQSFPVKKKMKKVSQVPKTAQLHRNYKKKAKKKGGSSLRSKTTTLTPARKSVWLEYVSMLTLTLTATRGHGYPLISNGAFAVDPGAPTGYTTTPGFSVLATNYAQYRVKKYRGTITFDTVQVVNAQTVVCHTNSLLGCAAGGSDGIDVLQFAANRPQINTIKPLTGTAASTSNPAKAVHRFSHTIASITGETIGQPGYKCLTNTVPSIPTYIILGIEVPAISTATFQVQVKLQMLVEYLDYIDTLTSFADMTPLSETQRLNNLGVPTQPIPCGGCKAVKMIEFQPCPDLKCIIVDRCTNCGYERRCSQNCQSPRCPFKQETVPLIIPKLIKTPSRKDVYDGFLGKTISS